MRALVMFVFSHNRAGPVAVASDVLRITRRRLRVRHSARSCHVSVDTAVPVGSATHPGFCYRY